ncbi:unnamed protein product [Durusdinium trenchii]|uniref:Uncharacterized protein n=1 Tax=Durusdinium trenchii TaxID=1381693 RepID=A0ABP0KYA1_9DINO
MALRATARLHKGAVVDFAVDRHFVYSLGEEMNLRIWSTELKEVVVMPIGHVEASCLMGDMAAPVLSPPKGTDEKEAASSFQLSRLSALKRPVSRWSGGQAASGRGSTNTPRGLLFVAGVMAKGQSAAGENAAVLMEWTIAAAPVCQGAVIAHARGSGRTRGPIFLPSSSINKRKRKRLLMLVSPSRPLISFLHLPTYTIGQDGLVAD